MPLSQEPLTVPSLSQGGNWPLEGVHLACSHPGGKERRQSWNPALGSQSHLVSAMSPFKASGCAGYRHDTAATRGLRWEFRVPLCSPAHSVTLWKNLNL